MRSKSLVATCLYFSLYVFGLLLSMVANFVFFIPQIIWGRAVPPKKLTVNRHDTNYYYSVYDNKFKTRAVFDSRNETVLMLILNFLMKYVLNAFCFFGAYARDIQYSVGSVWQVILHKFYQACVYSIIYSKSSSDIPADFHENDNDLKYVIENFGAPYVKKVDNGYVIDLLELQSLETRDENYYKFGAKMYLDNEFNPIFIETVDIDDQSKNTVYYPDTKTWGYGKMMLIASVFFYATVVDHLVVIHLIFGSIMSNAVYDSLPEGHELLAFLKPHTSYNYIVNESADFFLINKLSLLSIASPYSYPVLKKVINETTRKFKYNEFRERVDRWTHIDDPKHYPFGHFSKSYIDIIRSHVTQYFTYYGYDKLDYKNLPCDLNNFVTSLNSSNAEVLDPCIDINSFDDFVELLTIYLYATTVFHETIGGNPEKLIHANKNPLVLIQKGLKVSLLSETAVFVVGIVNNFGRLSRLIDLQPYNNDPTVVDITKEFISKLNVLSVDMRTYNYKLDKHYESIDPYLLETHAQY
ncbi:hypothetical protein YASMINEVIRUS_1040 [Yasminevirus sp. GU-2018]|uniref:Lipoxygenase domain-containing protein n=1 Tax=Yasminevirus sp. GU-2018 TaxID=2420051 RepID=A0A5K0U9D4_9VIRU|nr:hypothetical protein YASMINEVIRUS_1040 [Yasminevirus sp. GU-2018]